MIVPKTMAPEEGTVAMHTWTESRARSTVAQGVLPCGSVPPATFAVIL